MSSSLIVFGAFKLIHRVRKTVLLGATGLLAAALAAP